MRAVIDAIGYRNELEPLIQHRPTPLLKIADRPILFYIIEYLIQLKVKKFDIILHYLPEMIEKRLGTGKRWGIDITYHLIKDPTRSYETMMPIIQNWEEGHLIWGEGDTLPIIDPSLLKNPSEILLMYPKEIWSGWGIFSTKSPPNEEIKKIASKPHLSVTSFTELRLSNEVLLKQADVPHIFPTTARKVEPGVWISRAVSIHPSVKIIPPIFIGENCEIKQGVQIGPHAVIENHSIIDNDSLIQNSIVCQGSYVGETLEVKNCIVDRNLLINLNIQSHIEIQDDFILSSTNTQGIPFAFLERIFAAICLTILSPIYLYLLLSQGIQYLQRVKLPSKKPWTTFKQYQFHHGYFKRLPALINIIKGEMHLIGLESRSAEEVERLPMDWRDLYLKSKVGLITLSNMDNPTNASQDDIYASEAYYAIQKGFWYDLKLLFRWIKRKFSWR